MEGYGNENPGAFQSTRPLRGATANSISIELCDAFQPTRPLRGATMIRGFPPGNSIISTHAPLAGRDNNPWFGSEPVTQFQPTRPLRGATGDVLIYDFPNTFQPTRPLRGATRRDKGTLSCTVISTHAPLAGRDRIAPVSISADVIGFQPTRPLRGATKSFSARAAAQRFQPTRPLRGATHGVALLENNAVHFNPRAPCGARLDLEDKEILTYEFQPTRPLRGATLNLKRYEGGDFPISTHAPLAGRDRWVTA